MPPTLASSETLLNSAEPCSVATSVERPESTEFYGISTDLIWFHCSRESL
jgi:hypothetical protein